MALRFLSADILLDIAPPVYHDFLGPTPHRRSTYSSRARRSSLNTRPVAPGLNRDTEEDGGHNSNEHRPGVPDNQTGQEPAAAAENSLTRLLPKGSSTEMLLHYSLSIKIEDLPEQDRGTSAANTTTSFPKTQAPSGVVCVVELGMRQMADMNIMTSQERHSGLMTPTIHDEEEVGEAQFMTILEQQLRRSGETNLSAVDGENSPSDSSSAPASPIRASLRDASRFSQWSYHAAQQRANRRPRGSGSNLPPLQPLQSDGPTQLRARISAADARESESRQSPEDAGHGPAETSMAPSTAQSRNRPW
ncbi:hypothetical protein ACHAPE_009042 [Trichoderma viride]